MNPFCKNCENRGQCNDFGLSDDLRFRVMLYFKLTQDNMWLMNYMFGRELKKYRINIEDARHFSMKWREQCPIYLAR